MTRKKRKPIPVGTISALDVTRAHMPKHNGWVCRGGPHGVQPPQGEGKVQTHP